MTLKKRIKDLKKLLRKDGANQPLHVQLAELYREAGQIKEAVEVYQGVAFAYYKAQELERSRDVCLTILELQPEQREAADLLKVVNLALRAGRAASEVDALAARGDWVPSLTTPSGQRPITASGATEERGAGRAKSRDAEPVGKNAEPGSRGPAPAAASAESDQSNPLRARKPRAARELESAHTTSKTRGSAPGDGARMEDSSLIVFTPTPLPAPLAPHEADDEDSVVEDEIERYKLRLDPNPSGPLPHISLPDNVSPALDDDLLAMPGADEHTAEASHEFVTAKQAAVSLPDLEERITASVGPDEVVSFLDEDPTQLTRLSTEDRALLASVKSSERISTELPDAGDTATMRADDLGDDPDTNQITNVPASPEDSEPDPGESMSMRHKTVPRVARDLAWSEDSGFPSFALANPDDEDQGRTDEHPAHARPHGVPTSVDRDSTVRVAMPRISAFLEEPIIGSNPFIDLPERPDGLPFVIHDDMELTDALTDGLGEAAFADAFTDPGFGERGPTQRNMIQPGRDPLEPFAALPAEALKELASRMTMRHYATDQYIVRQEERARCCYALVSGQVSLLRYDPMDPDGDYLELGRLEPGDLFGDSCILPVRYSRGSALALSDCDLYEIPRRLLRELAAVHPGVDEALDDIYRRRALDSLFAMHPFLRGLKPHHQHDLRQHFETVHMSSGSLLLEEGKEPGGLFLVLVGAVEITKRLSRSRSTLLATAEEGSYLSDMSVLSGQTARVTVRAAGPLELAVLSTERFREVIDHAPELWETICHERGRGALERNYLLTGPGITI